MLFYSIRMSTVLFEVNSNPCIDATKSSFCAIELSCASVKMMHIFRKPS